MKVVMYKNDNAIFDFVLPDVIDRLKYFIDSLVGVFLRVGTCASKIIKSDGSHIRYPSHFPQMKTTLNKYIELLMLGSTPPPGWEALWV